jgi:hypothetical protein
MMHGKSYQQQAEDVHFSVGDVGIKLIFVAIFGVGIFAFVAYMIDNADISKSALWPTTEGHLQQIGSQGLSMPLVGRFFPIVCPFAKYSYTINGATYPGQKNAGACISFVRAFTYTPPKPKVFDEKEFEKQMHQDEADAIASGKPYDANAQFKASMDHMSDLIDHPQYEPVKVRYNLKNPTESVLDPDVLQSNKSELYSSILLMLIGAGTLGATYLHSYMTAPVENDPSLSLDAALAHRKRGGR